MGLLDEMKESYAEGYAKTGKMSVEEAKAEIAAENTAEKAKKPLERKLVWNIIGTVVLGLLGLLFFKFLGLIIGGLLGFFCGEFILKLIRKASPKLSTDGEDILINKE
jgi:F0F1-type ATP synthase assembly protein I